MNQKQVPLTVFIFLIFVAMKEPEKEHAFDELLEKNDLKKTKPRLSVLKILSSQKTATSQPVLEEIMGKEVDRVTLYRILRTFEEKGIIHKVIDMNGTANYATCKASCSEHKHKDEHVHFNCTACFKIYCLEDYKLPELTMPKGFSSSSINLIVYGICDSCNKNM